MAIRNISVVFIIFVGFTCNLSFAQLLTTKCWSSDWTLYLEKCYLVVNYQHSWSKANEYCAKYGARLVEPTGLTINDGVSSMVTESGLSTDYWIGYNMIGINSQRSYQGYWANGRDTSVSVGVWGHLQPDPDAGACTYVKATKSGNLWYTTGCDRVMPFVCEMDPCPLDSLMCSGICLLQEHFCDTIEDCADGRDEFDCPGKCRYLVSGTSGTIQSSGELYAPNSNCLWVIETKPGTRINVQFIRFETEASTDFLEIWDGGLTLGTSDLMARYSGQLTYDQMTFTSSKNFLILHFFSDATDSRPGFELTWTTDYICTYKTVPLSTFSNTEIESAIRNLASLQTDEDCRHDCDEDPNCYGFTYFRSSLIPVRWTCKFISGLPMLVTDDSSTIFMKTCPPGTSYEVPLPSTTLVAMAQEWKQLSTPLYPLPYVGNMELVYTVSTIGNDLITFKVLDVDLCCDDAVEIYDGTATSHTLLETLTSTSEPHLILSASQNVYIKMTLNTHWKCRGVFMTYTQGCDNTLTEMGTLQSPAYGSPIGYPGVMECTWTLKAPSSDRSITLVFETFELEKDEDFLHIQTADGTQNSYTGRDLQSIDSITAKSNMTLTFTTSAVTSSTGFKASFSPGCMSLESESRVLEHTSFNYLTEVKMSCAEGYYFDGDYVGQSEVALKCISGGQWDLSPLPNCARAYCGPPPLIVNGYITSSTGGGVQGADTASFACNSDFVMSGSATIKCNANGQWDAPPICTSGVCKPVSNVTVGVIDRTLYGNGIDYGSVTSLSCGDYKEIRGATTVKCVNGNWDFVNGEASSCHLKPCPTPLISNAYLSPAQTPYAQNQGITVRCKTGYELVGQQLINCGVTQEADLPICKKVKCILNFEDVVPADQSDILEYEYGETVEVTCVDGYALNEVRTTTVVLSCLSTGNFHLHPSCSRISCGAPQAVMGAEYLPTVPCYGYGCSFTLSCKEKYELIGASDNSSDNVVRCGVQQHGIWDFGNLACIGGQCIDPGYPPSGYTVGPSFQEWSILTFGCNQKGYLPIPPEGIICQYNQVTRKMEWNASVPVCQDIQNPSFLYCPVSSDTSVLKVQNMEPAGFFEPSPRDNTNIESFTISPLNFHPDEPIKQNLLVTYSANDYEGLSATCEVRIEIEGYVRCLNSKSLNYVITQDEVITNEQLLRDYVEYDPSVQIFFSPTQIEVFASSSMLQRIDEVEVTARDMNSNLVLDSCTLQFRYKESKCSNWGIHIPGNGGVSCQSGTGIYSKNCNAYCETGSYFMEAPDSTSILVQCREDTDTQESVWSRPPPVCAIASESYIVYIAQFYYKYTIMDGITDFASCSQIYRNQLESKYPTLIQSFTSLCNQNSQSNPFTLSVGEYTISSLQYEGNTLTVRIDIEIKLQNELVDNPLALKNGCASQIQTAFNTNTNGEIDSVLTIDGSTSCGSGTYNYLEGQPTWNYRCRGSRKYHFTNGERFCLTCPLGYYQDTITENCLACPDGKYGVDTPNGPECHDCPLRAGPNMTALTSPDQCSKPAIAPPGYYSKDGLSPFTACPKNFYTLVDASQECTACPSNRITTNTGSTSISDCKSLTDLGDAESPCNPNPCYNQGDCSFVRSNYFCTCLEGYTGRQCQSLYNACNRKPCKNDQPCQPNPDDPKLFTCECSSEFDGPLCENDVYGCDNVMCQNNGTCHNQARGSYSCKCPTSGGFTNSDGTCGTAVDQCVQNPCMHGDCIPHQNYYRSCSCYSGYTGNDCETDIDDCSPNPCLNEGNCSDGVNSFTCECAAEFYGGFCQFRKVCDTKCDGSTTACNTCEEEGTGFCEDFADSFICHCNQGFTGTSCETPVAVCNDVFCQHGGTCNVIEQAPGYMCVCSEPWTGTHCEIEKMENCPVGTECFNGGTCYSTPSGYQCECPNEYIGADCNTTYDLCTRVEACLGVGSTCSYTEVEGFKCSCGAGLSGESCQIEAPTCTPDYCQNGGVCNDSTGIRRCICKTGYDGDTCENNVDNCSPNLCSGTSQQCVDLLNDYMCLCDNGKRGENCDKDVSGFDYVIESPQTCRKYEDVASFGDGINPITKLSVAFWLRFTEKKGRGNTLNIYGSIAGDTTVPAQPDFVWRVNANSVTFEIIGRPEKELDYKNVDIADGIWHHIALVWSDNPEEMTLYVDGSYKDQLVDVLPGATRSKTYVVGTQKNCLDETVLLSTQTHVKTDQGFVVFGDYNTATGVGDSTNSFKGRISRLYIVEQAIDGTIVDDLYNLVEAAIPTPDALLLHQEKNLMLHNMVDYSSEISQNKCMQESDLPACGPFSAGNIPSVSDCSDVLAITERGGAPTWSTPTFTNTDPATQTSTRISGGSALDWGVYGVSYSANDITSTYAAVCSFRLYNYPAGCSQVQSQDASCRPDGEDMRCSGSCPGSDELTGPTSAYQTCSKYLMWNEAMKQDQEPYNYPQCSATKPLTHRTTLSFEVVITNTNCEAIKGTYTNNNLELLNSFNLEWGSVLCHGTSCASILQDTFACQSSGKGSVNIDFGYIPASIVYRGKGYSPDEVLKIAIADQEVFHFEQSPPSGISVIPDLRSLVVYSSAACEPGYQVSGSFCVVCGSGTFYDVSSSSCKRCAKGEYRNLLDDGTNLTSACISCPDGSTTASDGSYDINLCKTNCFPGQYYNTIAKECRECPVGFYQPEQGQFFCVACEWNKVTSSTGSIGSARCVLPSSITTTSTTTTTLAPGPSVGAATEDTGLSTGIIVAIILGVIIGIVILVLIVCLVCFKCQVPCMAKKTQEVVPEEKGGYYANKYGARDMRFVNYNLHNVREKKARPLDKEPFVEPPMSEESGSIKNDISIHVPVFMEKLDGSVSRKPMYMSNNVKPQLHTPRPPVTSSPRTSEYQEVDFDNERKHKRRRRKKQKKPAVMDTSLPTENGQVPKALSPMPQRIKSIPPSEVHIRPSSALERPRDHVVPSHYEDFLPPSTSTREIDHYDVPRGRDTHHYENAPIQKTNHYERQGDHGMDNYDDYRYPMKRIVVEETDDEDLR